MAGRHALELLAPARTADIGIEAVNHGADAVYIGGPGFGARSSADNISVAWGSARIRWRNGAAVASSSRPACRSAS